MVKEEELVDRTAMGRPQRLTWNVFFRHPPPLTWTSYFTIIQHIKDTKFLDMDCGSATLVDEKFRLHCYYCKGADHNPQHCTYISVEGWYGNKAAGKIEETVEFMTSNRNDRDFGNDRGRNECQAESWRNGSQATGPINSRHERK